MYERFLDLRQQVERKSLFLLGARQTGKSTLLRHLFPDAVWFDLLEADTFRELSARPELIRQSLRPQDRLVIVDEVQKLPALLDEVQLLIDRNPELRFILTGSSARKLRRGSANLLAGRAWTFRLFPLVSPEVGYHQLAARLSRGSMPGILDSPDHGEDLKAYIGTYLREEVRAEGLARSIESFSRFLDVAGQTNGEQVNYTAVGDDAGVPSRTVREFYQVLVDTLVGHILPVYQKTSRRKPVATAKFYFLDVGVANALVGRRETTEGTEGYGRALEHLVFLELLTYIEYHRLDQPLCYWRSRSQFEVDFVIGDEIAIEVKSKPRVSTRDYKGLLALAEERDLKHRLVVCGERRTRTTDDGVTVVPINVFLRELWAGTYLS